MPPRGVVGQAMPRLEDAALLRGNGSFVDDRPAHGALHGCFLRSPHAHANILGIDTRAAQQLPGVHAVLTLESLAHPAPPTPVARRPIG